MNPSAKPRSPNPRLKNDFHKGKASTKSKKVFLHKRTRQTIETNTSDPISEPGNEPDSNPAEPETNPAQPETNPAMPRILLVAATTGYQTRSFAEAARRRGIEVILATDRCHVLEDPWRDHAVAVRFEEPAKAAELLSGITVNGIV